MDRWCEHSSAPFSGTGWERSPWRCTVRRGSVIGPIILIVIGAIFLVNNIRPDLSVIDMLVRYWPFLLIAWGVLRLVEIFFSALQSKPYPTRGLSGGEWV